ncbi:MAG TPA: hypothetical protein VK203_06370 [Nostocaceae cyanobacterium]|nr:hypothetical protein [Nostocaceae cyanobacterium]
MVDKKLVFAAIIAWGLLACTAPKTTTPKIPRSLLVRSTCGSLEKATISNEITIGSNTVGTISNYRVGVANIWERELPNDKGVIAPRTSAILAILDPTSQQSREEMVFTGSVISLGSDRYCVINVEYSDSSSSSITLRKIKSGAKIK